MSKLIGFARGRLSAQKIIEYSGGGCGLVGGEEKEEEIWGEGNGGTEGGARARGEREGVLADLEHYITNRYIKVEKPMTLSKRLASQENCKSCIS